MSPNARWQVQDNEIYHIVTRGNNRMQVFHDSEDFAYYLKLVHARRPPAIPCDSDSTCDAEIHAAKNTGDSVVRLLVVELKR